MNHFFCQSMMEEPRRFSSTNAIQRSVRVGLGLLLCLVLVGFRTSAQSIPSSVTVSGACLSGAYTLTLVSGNYNSTGKPAYRGAGTVSINSTSSGTTLALYYEPAGPAWVLAFDGQPYQANYSSPALPPPTSYTAVDTKGGATSACSGSNPLTVSYIVPSVSVSLSATSVCSGSPVSLTAIAANFSSPVTSYTVSSTPAGLARSNTTGIFAINTPTVTTMTTYTLTVGAANSTENALTTAVVTVKPTPTLSTINLINPTRCDVPNGQINIGTNLPDGTYPASYVSSTGGSQTISAAVISGKISLTGLSGGQYYGFSISNNGCTATFSGTAILSNPPSPTVSITPSNTAICAGQSVQLMASGATTYVWSNQQTTATISVSATNTYSVTGITNGCSGTATASVTVNPLPVVSITGLAGAYCKNATDIRLTGSPTGGVFRVDGNSTTTFSPTSLSVGQHTVMYSYTNASGCSNVASQTVTISDVPLVSITGLANAYCKNTAAVQLSGSPVGGVFTVDANTTATFNPTSLSVGQHTVVYSFTNASGCSGTKSQTVTINDAPTVSITGLATAYCKNVTSFTLSGLPTNGVFTVDGSNTTTFNPTSLSVGQHTVVYSFTNASGCSNIASQTVTINALPTVAITGLAGAYCKNIPSVSLNGSPSGGVFTVDGNTSASLNPTSLSVGQHTVIYSYTNSSGCSSTTSQTVTINDVPTVSITGLASAYCQDAGAVTLGGSPMGGQFTLDGSVATGFNPSTLSVGQHTVVYSYTNSSGCSSITSQTVTIKQTPTAPSLVTTSGQSYLAGVSSLTVSQNTGSVILAVSGCMGGTISWNGGNATTLAVSTTDLGTQSFQATCTINGCTSPAATASITVIPTTLGVLYRDAGYGNTQDNIIQPYLELSNASNDPIPYSEITVRYWFTSEGTAPPTNFAVYYAPLGQVQMNYVMLGQPRQGATGYVEYSFPGGGNLPAQGNSGTIENGIQKADGSNFNELDDYSYLANYADYLPNMRITAYRKGVLFWGQEPALVPAQTVVKVYSAAKDGTTTSQIQTRLEVRNEGNTAVVVSTLKVRYYFTSDNGQPANVYVDYADIGASNVQARVVQLGSPVNGADSYVELTFMPGMPMLSAQSSLGAIDFRIVRSDYGLLDQSNDYSYAANYGSVGLNTHIPAYLSNNLVFGTPPSGAPARVAAIEPTSQWQARVLGNPVSGNQAVVEIKGVEGETVDLQLVDLQGRLLHGQRLEHAGALEQMNVPLGQSRGTLLLKVSAAGQQQQLKVVRP